MLQHSQKKKKIFMPRLAPGYSVLDPEGWCFFGFGFGFGFGFFFFFLLFLGLLPQHMEVPRLGG